MQDAAVRHLHLIHNTHTQHTGCWNPLSLTMESALSMLDWSGQWVCDLSCHFMLERWAGYSLRIYR